MTHWFSLVFGVLLQALFGFSFNWLCEMFAEADCNHLSVFMCSVEYMDTWIKPNSPKMVHSKSIVDCAMLCGQKHCLCALYLDGNRCAMAFNETTSEKQSTLFVLLGKSVSLNKPVHSTTAMEPYSASYVVDGRTDHPSQFYHAINDPNPWIEVDLEGAYQVTTLFVIPRQDVYVTDRFRNISVQFGNSLVTDGDFSSFEEILVIEGPHPDRGFWFFVRPKLEDKFRFIAIQRIATTGPPWLAISEIEILVEETDL